MDKIKVVIIIAIVILIIIIIRFFKQYKVIKIKNDNVICLSGGLGTGKTSIAVETALNRLKKNRRTINKGAKLYSNIPIIISKKEASEKLTNDILYRRNKLPIGSIVLLDEASTYIDNMQVRGPNVRKLDNFFRFYRHYTKGGYLIMTDQSLSLVHNIIRRRVNTFYLLSNNKKVLKYWHFCEVIPLINTDDSTIKEQDTDKQLILFGCYGIIKHYDTYCYSEKVSKLPEAPQDKYSLIKVNHILEVPAGVQEVNESNNDDDISSDFKIKEHIKK